jgi:5-methylcytosine-specific restriction protein A
MNISKRHSCKWPACPEVIATDAKFCVAHQQRANRLEAEREADYRMTPWVRTSKAFLNTADWKRLRADKIRACPFCEECEKHGHTTLAQHVHHIQPRDTRPDLALSYDNLCSLCLPCHSAITKKEQNILCR